MMSKCGWSNWKIFPKKYGQFIPKWEYPKQKIVLPDTRLIARMNGKYISY